MTENIKITSSYGLVEISKNNIDGCVFLGVKDGDWQEWRIIELLSGSNLGYTKIKILFSASTELFLVEHDTSVVCSNTRLKTIRAVLADKLTNKEVDFDVHKNEKHVVELLVKNTLSHYIEKSKETIKSTIIYDAVASEETKTVAV